MSIGCPASLSFVLVFLTAVMANAGSPNIVLLLGDDQGWGDFSYMGHPHIMTPHLDRLAAESLVLTRGYVPTSLCRPSLATLITGRYAHQHGIVGNDPPPVNGWQEERQGQWRTAPDYLEQRRTYISQIDSVETWPRLLHERLDFLSFQAGKWWEGSYQRGGFTHGMTHGDFARGGRHGDDGLTIGRQTMQPVFEFIEFAQKEKRPFFLWYAPMMPHSPHTPPERLLVKYLKKAPTVEIAKYWAMCEWYDETCGQLLNHLEERGLKGNTIVISMTDNGWINALDADHYLPRSKRSQYDGGVRTPMTIRWPGRVRPRIDSQSLASSIDLLPTVLSAVGTAPAHDLPGINLLDEQAVARRESIFGEIFEHDVQHLTDPLKSLKYRWVIQGEWKLIVPNPLRVPGEPIELFHITADPMEQNNLAESHPERVAQLTQILNDWWPEAAALKP